MGVEIGSKSHAKQDRDAEGVVRRGAVRRGVWHILCMLLLMLAVAAEASEFPAPTKAQARVTLDLHAVKIDHLIEVIGRASGLNMVVGNQVRGRVTVYLKDVPWQQALESILGANGYGYIRQGNVIRIDTLDVLRRERERRLARRDC